jgi:hypothetical protein
MAGRADAPTAPPGSLRVEVLKELQQLIDDRQYRDRLDKGPIAETKGREHWVLHLLLRAQEASQSHFDTLIGTAYANTIARLQALEDRISRVEELSQTIEEDAKTRFSNLEKDLGDRVEKGFAQGMETVGKSLVTDLGTNLDTKWRPIGDSIDTFAQSSRQLTKDIADTYRVATQTRLLLNENARRITDLGRDIVALEESLKLVIAKTIEEAFQPLEQRLVALEAHMNGAQNSTAPAAAEPDSGDADPAPGA